MNTRYVKYIAVALVLAVSFTAMARQEYTLKRPEGEEYLKFRRILFKHQQKYLREITGCNHINKATYTFQLDKNGNITNFSWRTMSGDEKCDDKIRAAVYKAAPFPFVPISLYQAGTDESWFATVTPLNFYMSKEKMDYLLNVRSVILNKLGNTDSCHEKENIIVRIKTDDGGNVTNTQLISKSDNKKCAQAALKAIQDASPLHLPKSKDLLKECVEEGFILAFARKK